MAKKSPTGPSGLIVVDKPAGLTSHDVVSKMRWIAGTRKVGHAGTLDPMATGVLILGINKATRLLTWVVGETKTYTATIRLGVSTLTDDADGEATAVSHDGALDSISEDAIRQHIADLTGDIMQVPCRLGHQSQRGTLLRPRTFRGRSRPRSPAHHRALLRPA